MYQFLEGIAAGAVVVTVALLFLLVVAIAAGALDEGRKPCPDCTYIVKTVSQGVICVAGQPLQ